MDIAEQKEFLDILEPMVYQVIQEHPDYRVIADYLDTQEYLAILENQERMEHLGILVYQGPVDILDWSVPLVIQVKKVLVDTRELAVFQDILAYLDRVVYQDTQVYKVHLGTLVKQVFQGTLGMKGPVDLAVILDRRV